MHYSEDPVTFIVGMSRGGTTWISNTLSMHPEIAVYGESFYWGRFFVTPDDNGYYTEEQIQEIKERLSRKGILGMDVGKLNSIDKNNIRELLDYAISQLPKHATPADLFLKINKAISVFENKRIVIEKTPHHVNCIGLIRGYFPNARFIIMNRSPYDFMLSFKHQANRLKLSILGRLNAKLTYHPIGSALVWKKYYKSIYTAKNICQELSYCEVMFEDLKQSPEKTLVNVQSFLGVDIIPELSSTIKKKNTSFPSGKRPQLKSDDIFWMNFICDKEISEIGIEKLQYSSIIDVFISFLKIPFWAIFAFIYLSKNVNGGVLLYIKRILY